LKIDNVIKSRVQQGSEYIFAKLSVNGFFFGASKIHVCKWERVPQHGIPHEMYPC
jgi:hypothetical protein